MPPGADVSPVCCPGAANCELFLLYTKSTPEQLRIELSRALAALGRRWLALDDEARELEQQIAVLIAAHARACSPVMASAR
jgi:hypothetical protein